MNLNYREKNCLFLKFVSNMSLKSFFFTIKSKNNCIPKFEQKCFMAFCSIICFQNLLKKCHKNIYYSYSSHWTLIFFVSVAVFFLILNNDVLARLYVNKTLQPT